MTQAQNTKFALVIPTLNEAGNIQTVMERACAALAGISGHWEILVVDDDSHDATPDIVAEFARSHDRVRLVTRRGEKGLAGAITYGWSQTDAELLGVMDADLQHPPEVLPTLLTAVHNGADIAIASRYVQPNSMDGWNPVRKLLSRIGVLASASVRRRELQVKDPLSGFFIVRRECIQGIEFQKTGFKLLLEILAKGRIKSVAEVPFQFASREHGSSKANAMTGVHYLSLLLKLSFKRSPRGEPQR